ncbi:hypothetical protein FHG87_023170 [Trinorchestia longiramus]|nr:hypothetical protein FHG87_023170 [Trinorchestia longiramus]
MNMTKHDLRLLILHEFKLGHNASEASVNIKRVWGEESTRDRIVRRWFGKFQSCDESLKDEEGRRRLGSLENEQLHAVVEQNPRQSVREMSQTLGVSIATVSHHLKIIGKENRPRDPKKLKKANLFLQYTLPNMMSSKVSLSENFEWEPWLMHHTARCTSIMHHTARCTSLMHHTARCTSLMHHTARCTSLMHHTARCTSLMHSSTPDVSRCQLERFVGAIAAADSVAVLSFVVVSASELLVHLLTPLSLSALQGRCGGLGVMFISSTSRTTSQRNCCS